MGSHQSVPRLATRFAQRSVLYQTSSGGIDLTLNVTNEWNRPLKVVGVDGGCSCRRIDQSGLPFTLRPGQTHQLNVWFRPRGTMEPTPLGFLFSTDLGNIACQARIQALPRHSVSPDSITLSAILETKGEQHFELAHREIAEASSEYEPVDLVASNPVALKCSVVGVHEDMVGDSGHYKFRDTTYRVSLIDHSMGGRREDLQFRSRNTAEAILTVPVVWQRVPFVSSTPERVILGQRPVRVFPRCPDAAVELTRVISSPPGVKAVVSSPRELIVQATDRSPNVLQSVVVVGTTAAQHPSLEVSLVRYQPR